MSNDDLVQSDLHAKVRLLRLGGMIVTPVVVLHHDANTLLHACGHQPVGAVERIGHECVARPQLIKHPP